MPYNHFVGNCPETYNEHYISDKYIFVFVFKYYIWCKNILNI